LEIGKGEEMKVYFALMFGSYFTWAVMSCYKIVGADVIGLVSLVMSLYLIVEVRSSESEQYSNQYYRKYK
jgi:hypothetical protein